MNDYIERKLISQIKLDKFVIQEKLTGDSCRIVTKGVRKGIAEILSMNAQKKQEKQQLIHQVLDRIVKNEVTYIGEIFLKQA